MKKEEMLQKNIKEKLNAKVNAIVKEYKSEVGVGGTFLGILTAITNIVQAVKERMKNRGIDEKDVKEALESAFKEGINR